MDKKIFSKDNITVILEGKKKKKKRKKRKKDRVSLASDKFFNVRKLG